MRKVVMERTRYYVLHCVGFLDLLAVSLVVPALPVHLKSLGASATMTGFISSIYGSLQLFSSPLFGRWSDKKGRLNVMMICLGVSGVGYLISSFFTMSLMSLALLRIFPGICKHTQDLCRCSLIEECPENKNQALGSFNAVASVGFMIGPAVHGHLIEAFGQERGLSISFGICSAIFAVNLLTVVLLRLKAFPAVDTARDSKSQSDYNGRTTNGYKTRPTSSMQHSGLDLSKFQRGVFISRFLLALSVMVFRSSFVLWLTHYNPDLSPSTIGYILSYNGFLGLAFGFLVGPVSNFNCYRGFEEKLQIHGSCMLLISFAIVIFSTNLAFILVAMTTLVMGTAVLRVCGLVLTVKYLETGEIGKVQGLGSSVLSVARFSSSLTAGMLQDLSFAAPNVFSIFLVSLGIVLFYNDCYPHVTQEEKDKQS